MEFLKRSDLACERSKELNLGYNIRCDVINGIECIYSTHKKDGKTESITVCTGAIWRYSDDFFSNAVSTVSSRLKEVIEENTSNPKNILTVCLGNKNITLDSLGPKVGEKLTPTRHIDIFENKIGVLIPGVEGQSGFNSLETVKSNLTVWDPDVVITVDSLCSRGISRVLSTVQISSYGILPGSGVGNHKSEISEKTICKPVISIGVPTVIQYSEGKSQKKPEDVDDFYVSHIESDIGIGSYASLISKSIEKVFFD